MRKVIRAKIIAEVTDAEGVKGCLIWSINEYLFRVYDANGEFVDYDLRHNDLWVTIHGEAAFYKYPDGTTALDHSPETLGLEDA